MKQESIFSIFVKYVSLNVMGMIGLSCYILADTFFVSKGLGANGLTALNLAIPIYNFINGCGLMIGMGSSTKYSISRAKKETEIGNKIFTNAFYGTLGTAAVFMLMGLFGSGYITALFQADEAVFSMTQTYLKVMLLFSPAYLINTLLLCFVRNDGNPTLAMTGMLTGSIANIFLDYLFIFPLGMGMLGAVLATGCAPLISILILSRHYLSKHCGFRLVRVGIQFQMLREFLSIGFPSFVTEVSGGIVILVLNMILLGIKGNIGVAAYGVIANIALVVIAIFTGIGQGIQPIMSRSYGQGDRNTVKIYLKYAIVLAVFLACGIYVGMNLGATLITEIFNSEQNQQLQSIAEEGIKLYFLYAPFAGVNIIMAMFFASTEKVFPAQMISLLRGCLLILPMTCLFSSLLGIVGVWIAFPLTEILVTICAVIWYKRMGIRIGKKG